MNIIIIALLIVLLFGVARNWNKVSNAIKLLAIIVKAKESQQQPFGISIINSSEENVKINLFNAYEALFRPNFGMGHSIEVKSFIPNTSYHQLLVQSMIKPFAVRKAGIYSLSKAQVCERVIIASREANGGSISKIPIEPMFSHPEESEDYAGMILKKFKVDAFTSMEINVLAKSEQRVYLWPEAIIDISRLLN